jgi:plasmid stabilization system protein ParE
VEFFATWCPKCRHPLADQHRLAATRPVRLIIVDVDEDPLLVQAFFTRNPPPAGAGLLIDQSGSARASWGVTGFPAVFLIDKAGIIREVMSGWGDGSAKYLAQQIDWVGGDDKRAAAAAAKQAAATKQPAAAKQPGAGRRGRGKLPPARERAVSPDEHARQLGVEVIR